jgi:divalent metal cation (Fe/Co/Zn/Cd) transporter
VASSAELQDPVRRIRRLQKLTIAWMIAEAILSLWAALRARSPALLAFGGDSAIELFSAAVVPWLAWQKRRLATITGSAALRADAAESMLCAYLSLVALLGLSVHAWLHVSWADPVAALAATPFLLWEARRAWRGDACGCSAY